MERESDFFEVAKFLVLQLDQVSQELFGLIEEFND